MIIGIWTYFSLDINEEYYEKNNDSMPISLIDNN